MGGEAITDSWFSSLWKSSRKNVNALAPEKAIIGILAFEMVALMSKIVHLWNCMMDKEIIRLRKDVVNSFGIIKLVSEDENLLMELAFCEVIEDLARVVQSLTRLGKKCSDPAYHRLEQLFDHPVENVEELNLCGYGWKKMEKAAKKMERFVAVTSQLHQEMEVLVELEQTLKRMQSNSCSEANQAKLLEFRQKVIWQRQEVKNLRDMSPWSRTYDYTVRLLVKSTITVIERLKVVLGVNQAMFVNHHHQPSMIPGSLPRSRSLLHSSVHPSDNHASSIFYSGPLSKSSSKLGPNSNRTSKKQQQARPRCSSHLLHKKHPLLNTNIFVKSGPFKGCMIGGTHSPIVDSCMPSGEARDTGFRTNRPILSPHTLGGAALSLHYANIVILIEKFASSPHLIGPDARDDLYNMLPTSIRTTLRARLRSYHKSLAFDGTLAAEWSRAISRILEWLSPLAHNMVRWHSERNFEKQHVGSKANVVLLVQTLYFADQGKAEAAITELLMGLNYLCHFSKDASLKALSESDPAASRALDGYLNHNDTVTCHG
ncbi:hypothetical protein Dimus_007063 [Dionaea muscipula]